MPTMELGRERERGEQNVRSQGDRGTEGEGALRWAVSVGSGEAVWGGQAAGGIGPGWAVTSKYTRRCSQAFVYWLTLVIICRDLGSQLVLLCIHSLDYGILGICF